MDSRWFKGQKDTDQRTKELMSYRNAFDALKEILEKEFIRTSCREYDSPNWAIKQVALNERNQVLSEVIKLITIEKEI